MRALRPVAQQETLVCWGAYQYFKKREPTGVVEEWSIHRLPDGVEVVRSDVDARKMPDAPDILTHFIRRADGRPKELILQYRKGALYAKATYTFHYDRVELVRDIADFATRREKIDTADNYVVDYGAVIAWDYAWRGYPTYMETGTYAMPLFRLMVETEEVQDLLGGGATRIMVRPLEAASLSIPAGAFTEVRRYEVTLPDDQEAIGWFDQHGIPLRWSRPDGKHEFVLMHYRWQDAAKEQ